MANPGCERQFERLLEEHRCTLRAAVARVCPRGVDAADVEQEVRVRLWQAWREEKKLTNPKSYLYRMAINATLDAIRRLKARREEPLAPEREPQETAWAALPWSSAWWALLPTSFSTREPVCSSRGRCSVSSKGQATPGCSSQLCSASSAVGDRRRGPSNDRFGDARQR